ncbi:hypothetical protein, partial [Rhodopirellula sallentina]|uniref:hypothetical protein n=1 Tax=Rhodopirellula sallentina TaxID=1263869 RepID=UPI0005C7AD06
KHLLEPTPEVLPLTSENEAAVAAIYMHAMNEIESEIFFSHDMAKEASPHDATSWQQNEWGDDDAADLPAEQTCDYAGDDLFEWRRLATNAYRDTSNLEVDLEPLPMTESERETAEAYLGYDGADEDTTDIAPKLNSTEMSDWRYLIEILSDRVLWDRDFETSETMLDLDPTQASTTKAAMGIEDGYSMSLVPDPPFDEIPRLVSETRKIVRNKPR